MMHYEPDWKKSERSGGRIKSLTFDYEKEILNIIEYQAYGKECLKQVPVNNIKNVIFRVHHSTGREHSCVYLDIKYLKNVRDGRIICYLPWKYDKKVIEEFMELAKKYNFSFYMDDNKGSMIGLWVFIIVLTVIFFLINYAL